MAAGWRGTSEPPWNFLLCCELTRWLYANHSLPISSAVWGNYTYVYSEASPMGLALSKVSIGF